MNRTPVRTAGTAGIFLVLAAGWAGAAAVDLHVRCESINALSTGLNRLTQAANLPPVATHVNELASEALSVPNLAGIDPQLPIDVYLTLPDGMRDEGGVVCRVPLADRAAALLALTNGCERVTRQDQTFLLQGGRGPEGADIELPVVRVQGSTLWLAKSVAMLDAVAALPAASASPVSGLLRIEFNADALAARIEEGGRMLSRNMGQAMQQAQGAPGTPGTALAAMDPAKILLIETTVFARVLRQFSGLDVGLDAGDAGVTLYAAVQTKPQTTMRSVVESFNPPSPRYLALIPDEALWQTAGGSMASLAVIAKPYEKLMGDISSAMNMPELAGVAAAKFGAFAGQCTGDYAMWLAPGAGGKGFAFVEVIGVRDGPASFSLMTNALAEARTLYEKTMPGITLETSAPRTVDGVPVVSMRYKMDMAKLGPVAGPAGGMMQKIFSWLQPEMAVVGNDLLFVFGSAGAADAWIGHLRKPPASSQALAAAVSKEFPGLKQKAEQGLLRLVDLVAAVAARLPGVTPEQVGALPRGAGGIVSVTVRNEGRLHGALRVTASEIAAVSRAVPQLQALGGAVSSTFMRLAEDDDGEEGNDADKPVPAPAAPAAPAPPAKPQPAKPQPAP